MPGFFTPYISKLAEDDLRLALELVAAKSCREEDGLALRELYLVIRLILDDETAVEDGEALETVVAAEERTLAVDGDMVRRELLAGG